MKPWPKGLLIVGIILTIGAPLLGSVITLLDLSGAYHLLRFQGITYTGQAAQSVGSSVTAMLIGLLVGILGVPIIVGAVALHYQGKPKPRGLVKPLTFREIK